MSHTIKIAVEFRDKAALGAAVLAFGGSVLGEGVHRLFSSQTATGYGFRLPGWRYPLVLESSGNLAFDDYGGRWGVRADLERLRAEYALAAADNAARAQGWITERVQDELVIYHPDGGVLRVSASGAVDTSGFTGSDCQTASAPIEEALGVVQAENLKPEYYQRPALIRRTGGQ